MLTSNENNELTPKECFENIIKMIEEKPELFQVFEDLCETSILMIKTMYLERN